MYRFGLGFLTALALSICGVVAKEGLKKRAIDVLDYVDPLISTGNGGELNSFNADYGC
jgi:hypothetical protein